MSIFKHIQLRRATESEFDDSNPILKAGEPAYCLDTRLLKIGDGSTPWLDLEVFINSGASRVFTTTVDIPAISVGEYENIEVTLENINLADSYIVIISPNTSLPDDLSIDYAYVSADNTITIKIINRVASELDGNGIVASSPISDFQLNGIVYLVEPASVSSTSTTTTPPPIANDIYTFGGNEFGQLGLGDNKKRKIPVFVIDDQLWDTFDLGHYHTLGINDSGHLYSCGYNYYGQLGLSDNGAGTNRDALTRVEHSYFKDGTVFASGAVFSKVSAGAQHSLAIDQNGYLFSFGGDSYGALGINSLGDQNKPTLVGIDYYFENLASTVTNCINGTSFALGSSNVDKTKYVASSGNTYRLENIPAASAVAILNFGIESQIAYSGGTLEQTVGGYDYYSDYVEIEILGDYEKASIATLNDGLLSNGQSLLYYENPNNGWSEISAGNYHNLGIKNSELYTWGLNGFGQLGNGDNRNESEPKKIGTKTNWTKVAAGNHHSLALDGDDVLFSFGSNDRGQLGLGDNANRNAPTQVSFDFANFQDANFTILPSSTAISIVSYQDENRYSFDGSYNPLERFVLSEGTYTISGVPESHPIAILNRGNESNISYLGDNNAGRLNVRGTTADGTYDFYYGNVYINVLGDFDKVSTYCFYHGYMGGRNLLYYDSPSYDITDVKAGTNHSVLLTDTNSVITFGQNHKGQLGTGDTVDRNTPYRLPDVNIENISAGGHNTMFVDGQKYILSIGDNSDGQLGLGDFVHRSESEQINSPIRWQEVFAGGTHSLAKVFSYFPSQISSLSLQDATENDMVGHRQLYVTWQQDNALDQGVVDYKLEYSEDGGTNWALYDDGISTEKYIILDGLNDTSNYIVRVAAVNNIGTGGFTAIPQVNSRNPQEASDPNFSNTVLYSHLDDGTNGLSDLSNTSATVASGIVSSVAGISDGKFSEGVRLTEQDNLSYSFANTDFPSGMTFEFFFRPNTSNYISDREICTLTDGTTDFIKLKYGGNTSGGYRFVVQDSGNNNIISTSYHAINDFSHVAIVRDSGLVPLGDFNQLSIFLNGTSLNLARSEGTYTVNQVILASGTGTEDFNIDEIRLSDIARYDDNFTPTTKPFGLS